MLRYNGDKKVLISYILTSKLFITHLYSSPSYSVWERRIIVHVLRKSRFWLVPTAFCVLVGTHTYTHNTHTHTHTPYTHTSPLIASLEKIFFILLDFFKVYLWTHSPPFFSKKARILKKGVFPLEMLKDTDTKSTDWEKESCLKI